MSIYSLFLETYPRLLNGLLLTVQLTVISLIIAVFIGIIFGFFSSSKNKFLKGISTVYVDIIRGTPLMVQIFFVYFGVPQALGINLTADVAGIITLSLNAGAYISEIFRGGIQAVNKGQVEAARSLGLSHTRTMIKVVLPQAIRIVIPSLINQFIITLKDTSLLCVIGIRELTQAGKLIIAVNYESFKMWAIIGVMYYIVNLILSRIANYVERRLSLGQSKRKKHS